MRCEFFGLDSWQLDGRVAELVMIVTGVRSFRSPRLARDVVGDDGSRRLRVQLRAGVLEQVACSAAKPTTISFFLVAHFGENVRLRGSRLSVIVRAS